MTKPPMKPTMTNPNVEKQPTEPTPTPSKGNVTVNDIESLSDADLNSALKLLRTEVRRRENEREALRPQAGSKVRILKGRPKYVGKVGTAVIVRKSRCFVSVPDIKSPAYVLISDLELVER